MFCIQHIHKLRIIVSNNKLQSYMEGVCVILQWIFACHSETFYINGALKDVTIYAYAPYMSHVSSLKNWQGH